MQHFFRCDNETCMMMRNYIIQNVPIFFQVLVGAAIGVLIGHYLAYLIRKYFL